MVALWVSYLLIVQGKALKGTLLSGTIIIAVSTAFVVQNWKKK
jgi:uncharacterized membrane protein YczE